MGNRCVYNNEMNIRIVIALLKAHGIRRVVVSPGGTNIGFVWSVQHDPFFETFSAVDERHASYLACGIAAETKEPVVLSCTGATASRNYMSALTEAYYRKLPILVLTSSQPISHLGNLWPQVTDRRNPPADCVKLSEQLPLPKSDRENHDCELKVNRVILELTRHGGGPAHLNIETDYCMDYEFTELPSVTRITRTSMSSESWPVLPKDKKIAVWIGAHLSFSDQETAALENFVRACNAVVLVDQTSGYCGRGAVGSALLTVQDLSANPRYRDLIPDLVIHVGEISGDYYTMSALMGVESWRVSEDGEVRDLLGRLTHVFEMTERQFFEHYGIGSSEGSYARSWQVADEELRKEIPEIPFSNVWIAQELSGRLPKGARLHLGILNSLRSWNYFLPNNGLGYCNTGGFGIDGCVSSMIGAALASPDKLFFGVFGDLAFFYDLNAIGNRQCGKNLRILIVNNGVGGEFSLHTNIGYPLGEERQKLIGAGGHFGKQSHDVVRHLAEDLGFKYLSASNQDEFKKIEGDFLTDAMDQSVILECFTGIDDDVEAQYRFDHIWKRMPQRSVRSRVSAILPDSLKTAIKHLVKS